ncbi:uncharacterized protein LOC133922140 [Phragmites australis]|uniref:uncharacterized protein LOC133922140 n=1 Tax=Phragmites australis TaxID=29695 RepID=UPI002D791194|nr:uncharacterized protein LOC133922140 [Phragmites australis]
MARPPTGRNQTRQPLEGGSPDPAQVPEGDGPSNRDQSGCEIDRSWMYKERGPEFIVGIEAFLRSTVAYKKPKGKRDEHYICCSFVNCKNEKQFSNIEQIRAHLIRRGFKASYTRWTEHGELADVGREGQPTVEGDGVNDPTANEDFDMSAFEDTFVENDDRDSFVGNNEEGIEQMLRDGEGDFTIERQHQKY